MRALLSLCILGLAFWSKPAFAASPGGVSSDLKLWLKADEGVTLTGNRVSSWDDQSSSNNDANESNLGGGSPQKPTYHANAMNFNPAVRFTDPGNNNASHLETSSNDTQDDMTLIAVFSTSQSDTGSAFWGAPALIGAENSGTVDDWGFGLSGGRVHIKAVDGNGMGVRSPLSYANSASHIALGTREKSASGSVLLYINAESVSSGSSDNVALDSPGSIGIGNHHDANTGGQYAGDISEVVIYNRVINQSERERVESYLAIKYGVTLSTNVSYIDSGSAVLFESTGNYNAYAFDIAGIGQDNTSGLDQPQSRSTNADSIVHIGTASALSNGEFLLWGNDNASTNETPAQTPPAAAQRLARIWRVAETGNVGTVEISFDLSALSVSGGSAGDFMLLISTSGADFSDVGPIDADSYISNVAHFSGVDFGDGDYFSLATQRAKRRVIVVE